MSDFFNELKQARVAGHPVHSMLIHFPSALFPISLIFDVLSIWFKNPCLACASFYSLAAGLLFGLASVFVGAIDYAHLPSEHSAWNKASLHGLLSITWLIIFAIVFGLKLKQYPNIEPGTPMEIIISTIAVIGLIGSNYLGGDLIFRHKLGFNEIDKT